MVFSLFSFNLKLSTTFHLRTQTLSTYRTQLISQTLLQEHAPISSLILTYELNSSCKTCGIGSQNLFLQLPQSKMLLLNSNFIYQLIKLKLNFLRPPIYNLLHIHIFEAKDCLKGLTQPLQR